MASYPITFPSNWYQSAHYHNPATWMMNDELCSQRDPLQSRKTELQRRSSRVVIFFFKFPSMWICVRFKRDVFSISYYIFDWYWSIYSCLRGHACGAKDTPQGHKFELHHKSPRDFPITSYVCTTGIFCPDLITRMKKSKGFSNHLICATGMIFCPDLITRMKKSKGFSSHLIYTTGKIFLFLSYYSDEKSHQSASHSYPYYATGVIFSPYLITWMKPLSYFVSIYATGIMMLLTNESPRSFIFINMFSTHLWQGNSCSCSHAQSYYICNGIYNDFE